MHIRPITLVYKLQILKRQIGSRTSSSGARLVVAVTSAALVSLVFQALPQTVMELPPLLLCFAVGNHTHDSND